MALQRRDVARKSLTHQLVASASLAEWGRGTSRSGIVWDIAVSTDPSSIDQLAADADIAATIITGAGTQAFSAGADLGDNRTHRVNSVDAHLAAVTPRGSDVFNALADHPKPVVAAINGYAIGIGCLITLRRSTPAENS